MWLELLLFFIAVWLLCKLYFNDFKYWEQKGFPHVKGKFPFGSQANIVLMSQYFGEMYQQVYNKLDPHPFGGIYEIRIRELILRDPEIIKKILIKDFAHFTSRNNSPAAGFLQKHLFNAEGDLWRALRTKLTPTFTSGKLKAMFNLFKECSTKLDEHFKQLADNEENIDVKDWMSRFTTDIICTCAFGLETNSLDKPDNKLNQLGQTIFKPFPLKVILLRLLLFTIPYIRKLTKFRLDSKELEIDLLKIITDTVTYREQNNIRRNDFLDLLIDIMNNDNLSIDGKLGKHVSEHQHESADNLKMDLKLMTAQSFVFFAAGFETSSSVQANCLYELALNQEIQDKLRDEIDKVLKNYNGEITYQGLQEMPYLEQVIFETMRKYPTLPFLNRLCTKDYQIPETNLVIDKGTRIIVPVYALHHDPKFYPDPDKFIPERFAPENKSSIPSCAYLPFGEGPRICIGMRFGLLQTKTGIVTTLSKYKLLKTDDTPERLSFEPASIITKVKEKISLKIVNRGN
uniref:Secreted Cytochrome-like protein n=1 Tax=Pristhesancus plagipennis TaxID=1955184 RepID=A0A2K8JMH2_PRIPG|nr:secreted Cytochrome-like protein [Pristhesancus plagipennis]